MTAITSLLLFSPSIQANPQKGIITFASVGLVADNNCDFNSIQAAIDNGSDEVRIVNSTFNENIVITNRSIEIKGGYSNCNTANNDNPFRLTTTLDVSSSTVIEINNNNSNYQVKLSNLWLTGGSQTMFNSAAGISITGTDTQVTMDKVNVISNQGTGVFVSETNSVFMNEVNITNNTINPGNGGGIYCESSQIIVAGASVISSNQAIENTRKKGSSSSGKGGGIFATDGCQFSMYSGPNNPGAGSAGIFDNSAASDGGGVYAELGSKIYLFGSEVLIGEQTLGNNNIPVNVSLNSSDSSGGGIYLDGFNTELTASGISVRQNHAVFNGGGIYANEGAVAAITRLPGGCWSNHQCNYFYNNQAGTQVSTGGAVLAVNSTLAVGNAWFEENSADQASAIGLLGSTATIEGSVFYRNNPTTNLDANETIGMFFNSDVTIAFSTLVDNNPLESTLQVGSGSDLKLVATVIYDVGGDVSLSTNSPGTITNYCLYSNEGSELTGTNITINSIDPFVDRLGKDFHLASSLLTDVCDTSIYAPSLRDFDHEIRGFDAPVIDADGFYDIGADEDYSSDVIYKNGFD